MKWYRKLHWQIILGMILGLIYGIAAAQFQWTGFATNWVVPFGDIFMNLLKLIAVPLVLTSLVAGVASLSDLVRSSLRLRPDRIPIGEVRGAEALDLLKAWGTGHPGGIGTIHAGSALGALRRLEQLIQEAVVTVPRAMIAETIDLIAVLSGRGSARRLSELARVEGLDATGDYQIQPLFHPRTGDHP